MIVLLQNKSFWVALITVVLMIVAIYNPTYSIDGDALAGAIVMLITYVVGVAIDPGPPTQIFLNLFKSRKFWMLLVGVLLIIFKSLGIVLPADMSGEQLTELLYVISALIAGFALENPVLLLKRVAMKK